MDSFGDIVIIRRNGNEGKRFPLTEKSCIFGRHSNFDIRIQIPEVSKSHAEIYIDDNNQVITAFLLTIPFPN